MKKGVKHFIARKSGGFWWGSEADTPEAPGFKLFKMAWGPSLPKTSKH